MFSFKKFICLNQRDSMDCGPACLQSIAYYYGKKIEITKVRDLCHITRNGVSLLGIAKAAESLGFKTRGVKINLENLIKSNNFPCILHWRQEHFVILYKVKIKKNKTIFYVADPAAGNITVDEASFKKAWCSHITNNEDIGVCLFLEPTLKFRNKTIVNNNNSNNSLLKFISYIKVYKKYYFQLFIGLILGAIFQLVFPFLTEKVIDKGIGHHDLNIIFIILIGFLFFIICESIVNLLRSTLLLHISARINITIVSDYLYKLLRLPLGYFDKKFTGDILQRVKDHDKIESFLVSDLLNIIYSFLTILIFGILLLIFNHYIFIIFLIGSLIYIVWILFFLKKRKIIDYRRFIISSLNQSSLYQLIMGIKDIKLNNCELEKRWEWEKIQVKLFKINISGLKLQQIQSIGGNLINEIKNILIILFSAYLVIKGEITLGSMMAIQYINGQLNTPVINIISYILSLQDAKLALDRSNEVNNENSEFDNKQLFSEINNKKLNISINKVYFRYNDPYSTYILEDISLNIPYGKTTAIVGISGTGKTTLFKLLLGFYKPEKGQILIGNYNLNEIDPSWWRSKCGVVMQDGFIFNDTIANNICINQEELNEEKIIQVCKITNIFDFIMKLPLNFNTKLGDDGLIISQGQKQRILIARALYKNPDFIFLDEATNSLDTKNESEITRSLYEFTKDKTKIIIAHRLSTIKNADQIIVLDKGKIIEIGNHKSLVENKGSYYHLVNNQL